MPRIDLRVHIAGIPAGTLRQDEHGRMSFEYDIDYAGIPLSISMPIANRTYGQNVVRPYLFGLLPDDERQRRMIAQDHDISPNNPVAMLAHIGLDCPGAVQFFPLLDGNDMTYREARYCPLSDNDIAERLRVIGSDAGGTWIGQEESWSLGGNQGKFALAFNDSRWHECLGTAPTTHIFKNGVRGYELQALNEFVCMRTAVSCGIPTAHVEYRLFEDEPALIIERYDRVRDTSGIIRRLHQEDICQALGVMPSQKYTSDGGPTTRDVLMLLAATSNATINLKSFTAMIFFNCLIGAPDAHAKNYSLLVGAGGSALLARMYDVASGLAYEHLRRKGRLAMAIGGENRFGRVGKGAIRRFAGSNDKQLAEALGTHDITEDYCLECMADLAQRIPQAMGEVFDTQSGLAGMDELREHLLEPIIHNCEQTMALL